MGTSLLEQRNKSKHCDKEEMMPQAWDNLRNVQVPNRIRTCDKNSPSCKLTAFIYNTCMTLLALLTLAVSLMHVTYEP